MILVSWSVATAQDWPTHRGNPQRTGNVDGKAGPRQPRVLWVHRSGEQFVASPVVGSRHLYLAGLGAFNSAALHAFRLEAKSPDQQIAWSKRTPVLKLPVVSSPAVVGGRLVFGDGMHQTDGAILHCLREDDGLRVWQLPMPGRLVHLEGSPTIVGDRIFMTGGNAGVFCVALDRVVLEGKEMNAAEVQTILDRRWKELLARYEEEKKKDPDFAVPPNEDQLPKPTPKLLWQKGKDRWHVDASLAVVNGRVFVASSYLDDEKIGERKLLCLQADDGSLLWQQPLRLNPWAGPTVVDDLILVGSSSIRFDPKLIPNGKGEVAAYEVASGKLRWQRDVPGGVVSPIACSKGLAIFTATDGQVRAWDVATGQERWSQAGRGPFFAGPAVAGDVVYAADLKGVVHAFELATGKLLWMLDFAKDSAVKAPGMVYGSPIVHQGRLYLATCNLEGEHARQPAVIVCIGEK
ncbi:MAG: PQQ-binding-like beta-propeller repeat protein [Gemmatales bacterium]|nr:PQQ-binding-like beta-propeller repeat protein [Gemmatales bacterium]MDW8387301.1 PQQ-binding-like beta-propeller repeat protein [Gemmatales bacterium]